MHQKQNKFFSNQKIEKCIDTINIKNELIQNISYTKFFAVLINEDLTWKYYMILHKKYC
jgi:hypothetical protein